MEIQKGKNKGTWKMDFCVLQQVKAEYVAIFPNCIQLTEYRNSVKEMLKLILLGHVQPGGQLIQTLSGKWRSLKTKTVGIMRHSTEMKEQNMYMLREYFQNSKSDGKKRQ